MYLLMCFLYLILFLNGNFNKPAKTLQNPQKLSKPTNIRSEDPEKMQGYQAMELNHDRWGRDLRLALLLCNSRLCCSARSMYLCDPC